MKQSCIYFTKIIHHLKILAARMVACSNFHTEDPQTLDIIIKNLVTWVSWNVETVHPSSETSFFFLMYFNHAMDMSK